MTCSLPGFPREDLSPSELDSEGVTPRRPALAPAHRSARRLAPGLLSLLVAFACGAPEDDGAAPSTSATSSGVAPGHTVGDGVPTPPGDPGQAPVMPNPSSTSVVVPMDMSSVDTLGPDDMGGPTTTVDPGSSVPPSDESPAGDAPTDGDPEPTVDPTLVDDFEDGNGAIVDVAGRVGHWGTYNDGTGTQMPAAGAAITPEAGGANGSGYAIHTSGSGFSDWGAGLQVDMNNDGARRPYDASAYDGITFYARGSGDVRVEFITTAIADQSAGGSCAADCNDAHGVMIEIGDSWQEFTIPFASAKQESWGTPADFDATQLLGINFKMTKPDEATPASFDFWLDEVRFLESGAIPPQEPEPEPEPLGPVSEPGMCSMDIGRYDGNGSVTYYTFAMGSSEVNCSYQITGRNPDTVDTIRTGDGRFFGAMNTADYNNSAMCGACVEVTRDGGRSVLITIVDQCPIATNPKCTAGHIDLSLEAFRQIGSDQEGHLGTGNGGATGSISWRYVECPVEGQNVTFRLKEPSRMDWNELLVQGHRWPITSVEIDGKNATRKDYNYWEPPGNMGAGPWRVRVTDAVGGVLEATVSRENMDAGVQFTCQ